MSEGTDQGEGWRVVSRTVSVIHLDPGKEATEYEVSRQEFSYSPQRGCMDLVLSSTCRVIHYSADAR